MGERNTNKILATNVLFLREESGLSQDDLEKLSGVSKTKISWIENNQYKKDVDKMYIQQIADALHVSFDVLTETNHEISSTILRISREIHKLPLSKEIEMQVEDIYEKTKQRGPFERSQACMLKGLSAYYKGHYGESYGLYQESYALAVKTQDEELLQKVRRNLASASMMLGMYEQAEALVLQTLQNTSENEKKAKDMFKIGTLYYVKGNFEKARDWYNEAITILTDTSPQIEIVAQCYQALGTAYHNLSDFDKAIQFTNDALFVAQKCGDLMTAIYAYKTLGEVYRDTGEISDSVKAFGNGIAIAEKIKRSAEVCMLEFEIASIEGSYEGMKRIVDSPHFQEIPPHETTKIFEVVAEKAFELGIIGDVRKYYRKANELLKK